MAYNPTIKSHALVRVKYQGFPKGSYPKNKDGELIDHVILGYHFSPPDYEHDLSIEDANRLRRRWADMYEFVNEEDMKLQSVLDKTLARVQELEDKLKKMSEKKADKKK